MTNQELFDLTKKHEACPWWPAGLVWDWEDRTLYLLGRSIDAYTAERLLLGSAVMWLVMNGRSPDIDKPFGCNFCVAYMDKDGEEADVCGDSLLATVLAACEAVDEDKP